MAPLSSPLYLRQLLAGRDFARDDPIARQMQNYVYLIGDRDAGEAIVIDAAYAPEEVAAICESDGLRLSGAIVTHYHADHAGGRLGGTEAISGITDLLRHHDVPVHLHRDELSWLRERTGIDQGSVVAHATGDIVTVGALELTLIHSPGHTEGSQCILFEGNLITGDTLFLDGCGRTDLPGGDASELYESLTVRLAQIPDSVSVYPGHAYSPLPTQTMGEIRLHNRVLEPMDREHWLARFSA